MRRVFLWANYVASDGVVNSVPMFDEGDGYLNAHPTEGGRLVSVIPAVDTWWDQEHRAILHTSELAVEVKP
jgi:hypothetical protein